MKKKLDYYKELERQKEEKEQKKNDILSVLCGVGYGLIAGAGWVIAGSPIFGLIVGASVCASITYLMVKLNAVEEC